MSDSHVRGTASVSRRRFLQAVGAAGIAAAGGPVILHATNKSGSKRPVVGTGAHTFEVYHDWGELPASIRYGNTHGVCEDAQGHIYIHHTVNATSERHDSMVVFDRQGRFVKSWGREFEGGAHGLHIRKEGSRGVPVPVRHETRPRREGDTGRRGGVDPRLPEGVAAVSARRRWQAGNEVLADERGDRAER